MLRNPVLLGMPSKCPLPMYTEKKQAHEVMFNDRSILLTTRPDPFLMGEH